VSDIDDVDMQDSDSDVEMGWQIASQVKPEKLEKAVSHPNRLSHD